MDAPATDWYQCRIERRRLKQLMRRTDADGLLRFGGFLALVAAAGGLALQSVGTAWAVPAFLLYGTLFAFGESAAHELSHGTVFRRRWLNEARLLDRLLHVGARADLRPLPARPPPYLDLPPRARSGRRSRASPRPVPAGRGDAPQDPAQPHPRRGDAAALLRRHRRRRSQRRLHPGERARAHVPERPHHGVGAGPGRRLVPRARELASGPALHPSEMLRNLAARPLLADPARRLGTRRQGSPADDKDDPPGARCSAFSTGT